MNKPVNVKISELRKARSLTQEQLGAKLGVTGQAVSKWEKGESLPDIMILPELCDILGVSVDALLEMPISLKNKNIVRDFCAYAKEEGASKALLDALSRLFNDGGGKSVDFGPDRLKVYDGNGMGFIMSGEKYRNDIFSLKSEDMSAFLNVLTDETHFAVIKLISINKSITLREVSEAANISEDMAGRILLSLMEREIICIDIDDQGKHGYLQAKNMAGVYMVLAGCAAVGCDGVMNGSLWFTRSNRE